MSAPTSGLITVEEVTGGFTLKATSVGKGYYSSIGTATQRDPHPRHGGGIDAKTAKANARLWAKAPGLLAALKECSQSLQCSASGGEPIASCDCWGCVTAAQVESAIAEAEEGR